MTDDLPPLLRPTSRKSGILTYLEPLGPPWPLVGLPLPLFSLLFLCPVYVFVFYPHLVFQNCVWFPERVLLLFVLLKKFYIVIMSLSITASSHRMPAPTRTSCDTCYAQGHDKRDTLYVCVVGGLFNDPVISSDYLALKEWYVCTSNTCFCCLILNIADFFSFSFFLSSVLSSFLSLLLFPTAATACLTLHCQFQRTGWLWMPFALLQIGNSPSGPVVRI